ncbi:MAG: hypothetical protein OQK24_03095 [Magnetovibrio sp.]|nr:hypothetical protein [Magnetovibrio sp.]
MEIALNGYDQFAFAILNVAQPIIKKQTDLLSDDEHKKLSQHILFGTGPKIIRNSRSTLTAKQKATMDLFQRYSEIDTSIECLRDTPIYISRYPYTATRVDKSRHLNQMIGHHFNEIYIFLERLKRLKQEIDKHCIRTDDIQSSSNLNNIYKKAEKNLKSISILRARHTHHYRYTDDDLDRFSTLNLISNHSEDRAYQYFADNAYKHNRKKWKTIATNNVTSIEKLLNEVFSDFHKILFTKTGRLRFYN